MSLAITGGGGSRWTPPTQSTVKRVIPDGISSTPPPAFGPQVPSATSVQSLIAAQLARVESSGTDLGDSDGASLRRLLSARSGASAGGASGNSPLKLGEHLKQTNPRLFTAIDQDHDGILTGTELTQAQNQVRMAVHEAVKAMKDRPLTDDHGEPTREFLQAINAALEQIAPGLAEALQDGGSLSLTSLRRAVQDLHVQFLPDQSATPATDEERHEQTVDQVLAHLFPMTFTGDMASGVDQHDLRLNQLLDLLRR